MEQRLDSEHILTELADGWLTVRLNRPESRNVLSREMVSELTAVLRTVHDDRSVRGITFVGEGGVFCAGGDLKSFKAVFQGENQDIQQITESSRQAGRLFHLISRMPQVVVMLIEGAAMAGGLGMACAGDIVIVTKDARFALTETTLGIPPAQIAPLVVQRIGVAAAKRLMLTAAKFDGVEAGRIGVADIIVENHAAMLEAERSVKADVSRCAAGAIAETKKLVLAAPQLAAEEMINQAADSFARCMLSDEAREGIAAFIEKRQPGWATE